MATSPWDQVPDASAPAAKTPAPKPASAWDQVPDVAAKAAPEPWQSRTKDYNLPNGKTTKQREDGLVWVDKSKGSGLSGWADPASVKAKPDGSIQSAGLVLGPARPPEAQKVADDVAALRSVGVSDEHAGLITRQGPNMYTPGQYAKDLATAKDRLPGASLGVGLDQGMQTIQGGMQHLLHVNPQLAETMDAQALIDKGIINIRSGRAPGDPGKWYNNPVEKLAAQVPSLGLVGKGAPVSAAIPEAAKVLGTMTVPVAAKVAQWAAEKAIPASMQGLVAAYFGTPGSNSDRAKAGAEGAIAAPIGQAILGEALPAAAGGAKKAAARFLRGAPLTPEAEAKAAKLIADAARENTPVTPSTIATHIKPGSAELTGAAKAVADYSDQLGKDIRDTPFLGIKDVEAASQGTGKRATAAKAILDQIQQGGEEARNVVQTSAGLQAFREKMRMDQLFGIRDALAKGVNVKPEQTLAALDAALSEVNGADASKWPARDSVISKLQELRDNLAKTTKTVTSKLVDPQGNPITKELERPNSFMAMSRTRSDIGDELADYFKGNNAEIGQKGAHIIQSVKDALSEDISNAAQNSGKASLAVADTTARGEYAKFANTFRDPAIVKLIGSDEPTKIMAGLARATTEHAQKVYDVLDDKGRRALLKGVFDEAVSKELNKRTGDFIPGNVSGGIVDKYKALGIVANAEDKVRIDGLLNITQALAKADPRQASALGARITSSVAEGTKVGHIGAILSNMRGAIIDKFMDTPAGRKFLFQAGTTRPGSPAFQKLMDEGLPKFIGATAANANQSSQEAPQ